MERTNEPKIVLLVRLLNAIDHGRFSFEELKDRISEDGGHRPSTRSLRRYLAVLADAGFPWYFDRATNTYRFADGYSLKRMELNESELFGLVALRAISASLGGALGTYVDEVTAKLVGSARGAKERVTAPSPVTFRLSEIRLDEQGERIFGLLSSAERNGRSVSFTYLDKEGHRSKRIADPYGFVVSGGRVYCVAHDHDRREKRTFAVDSISELAVLAQSFVKPVDFSIDAYAASSISGVLHSDQLTDVRVRFAPRVAKAAAAARVVADRSVDERADGSVEIRYAVADVDELIRWILSWGAEAEIAEPAHVRDRLRFIVAQIAAKYELASK